MKMRKEWRSLAVCLFLAAAGLVLPLATALSAPAEQEATPVIVGRVYDVEGDLLRYIPETKDWTATTKDAPVGEGDAFYSGAQGKAEIILPNGAWIRVGANSQIQFIHLGDDLTEVDVASGVVRFYNKGDRSLVKATCDFGYAQADAGEVFDFYVGEDSVEVVPVKGSVTFVHTATNSRYDASPGDPSILANKDQVGSGEGTVDQDWDQWNSDREDFWAPKIQVESPSVRHLPPSLRYDSYVFDDDGRWETVQYAGEARLCWRPIRVEARWSPFTVGRWCDWHGDQTWIPAERFGYVTHHHGNWLFINSLWFWEPPVARVSVVTPVLDVGFFWNPGRVLWIHEGDRMGWVPCAPGERYYCHRRWGDPFETVVTDVNVSIDINIRTYAFASCAVIVPIGDFYGGVDYGRVRIRNIDTTVIVGGFLAAPILSARVIPDFDRHSRRFDFSDRVLREKPHSSVIVRIDQNEGLVRREEGRHADVARKQVASIQRGQASEDIRIERPRTTNYLVPPSAVNQPKSEMKFQKREIVTKGVVRGPETGVAKTPATRPRTEPGAPVTMPGRPKTQPVEPTAPATREQLRPKFPGAPSKGTPEQVGGPEKATKELRSPRGKGTAIEPPTQPGPRPKTQPVEPGPTTREQLRPPRPIAPPPGVQEKSVAPESGPKALKSPRGKGTPVEPQVQPGPRPKTQPVEPVPTREQLRPPRPIAPPSGVQEKSVAPESAPKAGKSSRDKGAPIEPQVQQGPRPKTQPVEPAPTREQLRPTRPVTQPSVIQERPAPPESGPKTVKPSRDKGAPIEPQVQPAPRPKTQPVEPAPTREQLRPTRPVTQPSVIQERPAPVEKVQKEVNRPQQEKSRKVEVPTSPPPPPQPRKESVKNTQPPSQQPSQKGPAQVQQTQQPKAQAGKDAKKMTDEEKKKKEEEQKAGK